MPCIPPRGENKPHEERCRKRIEEAIKNDDEDKERWAKHNDRINQRLFRKREEQQEHEENVKQTKCDVENEQRAKKREGEDGEQEAKSWEERRKARAERRQQERNEGQEEGAGVKRRAEDHKQEDQQESKTQVVEEELNEDGMVSPLWRNEDRIAGSVGRGCLREV